MILMIYIYFFFSSSMRVVSLHKIHTDDFLNFTILTLFFVSFIPLLRSLSSSFTKSLLPVLWCFSLALSVSLSFFYYTIITYLFWGQKKNPAWLSVRSYDYNYAINLNQTKTAISKQIASIL